MGLNFTISTAHLDVTGGGCVVEPEQETGSESIRFIREVLNKTRIIHLCLIFQPPRSAVIEWARE